MRNYLDRIRSPLVPYGTVLAEINRDLDTLVKYSKVLFDRGVNDPVVTQAQIEILENTYLGLRTAQQEIDALWLCSKEYFSETEATHPSLRYG